MIEEITKAIMGWVLKPGADGTVNVQIDVLLSLILIAGLALLYKYQLRPLFSEFRELLPQWKERATRLDQMLETHGAVHTRLGDLASHIEQISREQSGAEERLKALATQLITLDQGASSDNRELHSQTQRSILEWLERAEDRTSERDRQLAVIQSEIRNLSTLLMATSATRYSKPLN